MGYRDWVSKQVAKVVVPGLARTFAAENNHLRDQTEYLQESMSLMALDLENAGYRRMNQGLLGEYRYTRQHLDEIVKLCVNMAYKNGITARTVNLQADYVFGQGISYIAKHPWVQEVIDECVNYLPNKKALTSHTAMTRQEKRQQTYGSMFIMCNTNTETGRVQFRNISMLEVANIVRNPGDVQEEWYIKHATLDAGGREVITYHPILGWTQASGIPLPWLASPAEESARGEILWNAPVLHVAYNRIGTEKYAIPELYPQIDIANSHKTFIENWLSIMKAFSRMALKISGLSGKKQAAAAKSLIQTSVGLSNINENNPSPVAGSTGLFGKDVDIAPVKTAGATTSASEGDTILKMAASSVGYPGQAYGELMDKIDRTMENKILSRRTLWKEIMTELLDYVVMQSVIAPEGILAQYGATVEEVRDVFTGQMIDKPTFPANKDVEWGDVGVPIDPSFSVHFPEMQELNVTDRVRALVNAVTLFGKPLTDLIPDKRLVARLLLQAMNIPDANSYIPAFVKMWEANKNVEPGDKSVTSWTIGPPAPAGGGMGAEDPAQGGAVGKNG